MDDDAVKTLLSYGKSQAQPVDIPNTPTGVMVPAGYTFEIFRPQHELPPFIDAQPQFTKLESFLSYVEQFKTGATQIFANKDGGVIKAFIDYHMTDKVQHNRHIPSLAIKYSEELKNWLAADKAPLNQLQFAEFIEDNMANVVEPDGGLLLDIVTNLSSSKKVEFQSSVRLNDGMQRVSYSEEGTNKGRNDLDVPSQLKLALPIFYGEDDVLYSVGVTLRCRIKDGQAIFVIKMKDVQKKIDEAFTDLCEKINKALVLQVLQGSASRRDY